MAVGSYLKLLQTGQSLSAATGYKFNFMKYSFADIHTLLRSPLCSKLIRFSLMLTCLRLNLRVGSSNKVFQDTEQVLHAS